MDDERCDSKLRPLSEQADGSTYSVIQPLTDVSCLLFIYKWNSYWA